MIAEEEIQLSASSQRPPLGAPHWIATEADAEITAYRLASLSAAIHRLTHIWCIIFCENDFSAVPSENSIRPRFAS
jgi:hypothetical protein